MKARDSRDDKSLCAWLQRELDKDLKSVGGKHKNKRSEVTGTGNPEKRTPSQ